MKFQEFTNLLIQKADNEGRYSTVNAYQCAMRNYLKFTEKPTQTFEEMSQKEMKSYEQSLLKKGRKLNTISLYFRMIRAICNQAFEQKVTLVNPADFFHNIFMTNEMTAKRAISPSIIGQLVNANFDDHPQLRFSRDLFLLSFYLRGIPFVDMAHLRKVDMQHNTIVYFRQKTKKRLYITVEDCALKIIQRYAGQCKDSAYLLPIINEVGEEGYKQYRSALRLYNKHLNQISKLLNLGVTLTSYVARHSWATTAQDTNVPIAVISTSMGHASEKMTRVYLDSFENKTLSDANKKVIAEIVKGKKKI